jgi:5'-methylthioadenosine phosphorylase
MTNRVRDDQKVECAVIGGSGLYAMDGIEEVESVRIETPFGDPSDEIVIGTLAGRRIAFLARHGRGHVLTPSEVNYRANIFALKSLGVKRILSVTCCGSLKKEIEPGHVVVPDQIYDNTKGRPYSFFGGGLVAHVSVADPFCPEMRRVVADAVGDEGGVVHESGTFVIIEGPRFSTKAESRVFRKFGFDIIGMTAVPEAQLAREAEICYASLAHITDYDVWNEKAETATVDTVLKQLEANTHLVNGAVRRIVPLLADLPGTCGCPSALADAIITDKGTVSAALRERLGLLVDRYF